MSEEQTKLFVKKLHSDKTLKERFSSFLKKDDFSGTAHEVKKVDSKITMSESSTNVTGLPASEHWDP